METVPVDDNAEIIVDGAAAGLADLRPGLNVALHLSGPDGWARQVEARGPAVSGTVKAVDPAAGTITLTFGREGPREVDSPVGVGWHPPDGWGRSRKAKTAWWCCPVPIFDHSLWSEGFTPLRCLPKPMGVGLYSPTRSTSDLAGILSSMPMHQ